MSSSYSGIQSVSLIFLLTQQNDEAFIHLQKERERVGKNLQKGKEHTVFPRRAMGFVF